MLLDVFDQAVLILPHLEKIIVLAELFNGAFTVGAEATDDIFLSPKSLIERAVPTGVRILINEILVVELLKISLDYGFVLEIRRSNERIVRDVEALP